MGVLNAHICVLVCFDVDPKQQMRIQVKEGSHKGLLGPRKIRVALAFSTA